MSPHSEHPTTHPVDDETAETVFDSPFSAHPLYQKRSDLFHLVHADHRELLGFFRRLADSDPADHAARWRQLSVALNAHLEAEREVLSPNGSELTLDLEMDALLALLDGLPTDDPRLKVLVQELERRFADHVTDTEQVVLANLETVTATQTLEESARLFERRRRQIGRELGARRGPETECQTPSGAAPHNDQLAETPSGYTLRRTGSEPHIWRPSPSGIAGALQNRAPATPTQAPVRVAAPERAIAHVGSLAARILVVDDDPTHARRLRQILVDARYTEVEVAIDPRSVHRMHRKNPYDLILLDLDMPRMSGFEVMATIRQLDPDGHHLPVMAITSDPIQQVPALRAGARDVIGKPFDEVEVLSRVSAVLEVRMPEVARRQRYRVIEHDLGVAGQIYRALLPASLPAPPGYDVAVVSESATHTSGDIYDVVARANGNLVLLLADATGHGFGPALSATQLRSMVRIALELGASLEEIVTVADRQLAANLPPDRFVTAFLGELDPRRDILDYFAPGQGPLLHWHAATQRAQWHNASGPPFGVAPAAFERAMPMHMEPGDVVVLATDGVFERTDRDGALFGTDGVEEVMRTLVDGSARDIAEGLRDRTDHHAGGRRTEDDFTVLVLKRV